jgi:PAS domain S-box-containing protein
MVIGTSGIAHDITKRLKQEAELRFLSTAVNQINEGITVFDRSGTISYVNSAFASMHGYQPSEMIGRQCTEFHSAQNITDLFSSREDHMRKSSYCGETLHFHKDGSTFPCRMNMSVLRDEKGYTAGIIATVRDISDEKSAQDSILASEERFRMFANASIDMIHLLDQDGTIIYANPISEKLLGYPIELLNTMNVLDLLHPKDRVSHKSEVGQFLLGLGPVSSRELRMKKADGVYIYVELRGFKLSQFGKGSLIGAIIRDISERKENELILCESEKQLREQAHKLEKKNIALNELLSQIELEKRYIKDSVVANIDKLIFPLIKKMRLSGSLVDHKYLDMLESNLSDLTSSFGHRIADKSLLLTPREIEICNLIKNGVTNKQISEMLHISLETTETHRSNIRKKLDIANKSVNLSVYLQSI